MSALISELRERDVPAIDWEKLALDNSSVYDICTGLKLCEELVRAGREIEVKKRSTRNKPVARESGTVLGWIHRKDQDW